MSAEFIGFTQVEATDVWQPPQSEKCLATLLKKLSDVSLAEAHEALRIRNLSEHDGSTAPFMKAQEIELGGLIVSVNPFQTPLIETASPQIVLDRMDEQFEDDKAVLLLHKKNGDPDDNRHHFILLTGYVLLDGARNRDPLKREPVHAIDTLEEQASYMSRREIAEKIKHSMDFAGVYAYAVSTDANPAPAGGQLTIESRYDEEPAPIEDTYKTTGQDKISWD